MRLFQILFLLTITLLLFASCQKEQDIDNPDVLGAHGVIEYYARGMKFLDDNDNVKLSTTYYADAFFRSSLKSNATYENAGTLDIGKLQLNFNPNSRKYSFLPSQSIDPLNATNFGSVAEFSISGGDFYAPLRFEVKSPQKIYVDTVLGDLEGSIPKISKSNLPFRIRWNKDSINLGVVSVVVGYNQYFNKLKLKKYLERKSYDIGFFDLDPEFLKNINLNDTIDIILLRAESKLVKNNDKRIYVNVSSFSEKQFILTE